MGRNSTLSDKDDIQPARDSRFYDLLMESPLILFSGFALAGFFITIPQQWRAGRGNDFLILSELASAVFLGLQLVLLCIRRLPINKAEGFGPRAWAFVGANFGYALLLLPRIPIPEGLAELSSLILVTGTFGSVIALIWLGKAFAIFPQARALVTTGPYAYVRHPLYLFEQLAMLGVSLQYRQPWAVLLVIASFGLQFPRMYYEEKVLRETFAGYDSYARKTPRLIPRLARKRRPAFPAGT